MTPHTPGTPAAGPRSHATRDDPLVPLAALSGVADSVAAMRVAVDRVYGHRVMRRRSAEVTAEAVLRGARASAALAGADWALEEIRRRSDFGADTEARTVGAALRVTAEAGQLLDIWRVSPLRVLARLHLVAAGGAVPGGAAAVRGTDAAVDPGDTGETGRPAEADAVGRPRVAGERVTDHDETGLPLPDAAEVAARLDALNHVITGGSNAPALVLAAVVHGELQTLRPFVSHNGVVARAAERMVLIGGGLDPKAVAPAEVGHAEVGKDGYRRALADYAAGDGERMAAWIAHCGEAAQLGARESVAVCEALQRGAA